MHADIWATRTRTGSGYMNYSFTHMYELLELYTHMFDIVLYMQSLEFHE